MSTISAINNLNQDIEDLLNYNLYIIRLDEKTDTIIKKLFY